MRAYEPSHEILGLSDYRTRYAQYRRDPDLQALHAKFPLIGIWDDHEAADNSFKDADQWDGYAASRQRIFDLIRSAPLGNVVVLSGDIHSSGAAELSDDPNNPEAYDPESGAGSLAVEFVTPAITSPAFGSGANTSILPAILAANPHIKYADVENRGYVILDVTRQQVRAEWHHLADVERTAPDEMAIGPVFVTPDGSSRVIEQSVAASAQAA